MHIPSLLATFSAATALSAAAQGFAAPPEAGTHCRPSASAVVVFRDQWLPRAGTNGRWPLPIVQRQSLSLTNRFRDGGQQTLEIDLEVDETGRSKPIASRYPDATLPVVRAVLPKELLPSDFERGARMVRAVMAATRQWACQAPTVRVVAEGLAGIHVRAYLQSSEYAQDVEQFIGVGVPHLRSMLMTALRRHGPAASGTCLRQLGISGDLARPESKDAREYLGAIGEQAALRDSLNGAMGRWRTIHSGLDVVDIVLDADSMPGRTVDCVAVWKQGEVGGSGIASIEGQRFPLLALPWLVPPRTVAPIRGVSIGSAVEHPSVIAAVHSILTAQQSSQSQRRVLDSALIVTNGSGTRSGVDEEFVAHRIIVRKPERCRGAICTEDDSVVFFVPDAPLESVRLARLDSLSRIRLPVYSAGESHAIRPTLQALKVEHFRGPTFLVVDSVGRLGQVEPRHGVFPNGLRGARLDSLCVQGNASAVGPRGSVGRVRALSTLRLCSLVGPPTAGITAQNATLPVLPNFREWEKGDSRCVPLEGEDAGDSKTREAVRCSTGVSNPAADTTSRELSFETPDSTTVELGSRTLYLAMTSEAGKAESVRVFVGLLVKDQQYWVETEREDRRTWSEAKERTGQPAFWDPEISTRVPTGHTSFVRINQVALRDAVARANSGVLIPERLDRLAVRIEGAVGVFTVRLAVR